MRAVDREWVEEVAGHRERILPLQDIVLAMLQAAAFSPKYRLLRHESLNRSVKTNVAPLSHEGRTECSLYLDLPDRSAAHNSLPRLRTELPAASIATASVN